jgi:hypothetical protein
VTPIQELISALPVPLRAESFFIAGVALNPRPGSRYPAATRDSADETKKRLVDWNEMWAKRRQRLNVYAAAHPDEQVRHLINQLVSAVDQLRDALNSLEWKSGVEVYNVAKARHDEAATIATALLNRIRAMQRR